MTGQFRILVFESQDDHRAHMAGKLNRYPKVDFQVTSTIDHFMDLLEREHYELVILDTDFSNFTVSRLVRAVHKNRNDQAFLFTTSKPSYERLMMALQEGALDCFIKPLDDVAVSRIFTQHKQRIFESRTSRRINAHIVYKKVKMKLPSEVHILPDAANRIAEDIYSSGMISPRELYNLNLAILECLTNALEHGNLGISYDAKTEHIKQGDYVGVIEKQAAEEPYCHMKIAVTYKMSERGVFVHIADEGKGFDVQSYMKRLNEKVNEDYHGRGILLAMNMVDDLRFNDKGNRVTLHIKRPLNSVP